MILENSPLPVVAMYQSNLAVQNKLTRLIKMGILRVLLKYSHEIFELPKTIMHFVCIDTNILNMEFM